MFTQVVVDEYRPNTSAETFTKRIHGRKFDLRARITASVIDVVSEYVQAYLYTAHSLDGPWWEVGSFNISVFEPGESVSNLSLPDSPLMELLRAEVSRGGTLTAWRFQLVLTSPDPIAVEEPVAPAPEGPA